MNISDVCVINVAVGNWYPRGQDRLLESVKKFHPEIGVVSWRGEYPPNSPSHHEISYAFKVYAITEARKRGYKMGIWMDCALQAHRPLTPLIDYIEKNGHYLQDNAGWTTGQWSTDTCLNLFGISREEALKMPHLMACIMGFDFRSDRTCKFLDLYQLYASNAQAFNGSWSNSNKECSTDERVLGHRHDQTVASILSIQLGMTWELIENSYAIYANSQQLQNALLNENMLISCCGM